MPVELLQQASPASLPWDLLGHGTATAAVIIVSLLFLGYIKSRDATDAAAREAARKDYIDSLDRITNEFSNRMDESHERVETALRDLIQEIRKS